MFKTKCRASQMSCADAYAEECHTWVADVVRNRQGPRKAVLAGIARETGLHARRVFAHFYKQVRKPTAAEYEQLRRWRAAEAEREMARLRARLSELSKYAR